MANESRAQDALAQLKRGARGAILALAAAVLSMGCAANLAGSDLQESEPGSTSSALTTTANQSLLITMTSVTRDAARTEDPCTTTPGNEDKVWTIGNMLKREAEKNGIASSTYVTNLMNAWNRTVTINGQTVDALNGANIRSFWQRYAGGSSSLPLYKALFFYSPSRAGSTCASIDHWENRWVGRSGSCSGS